MQPLLATVAASVNATVAATVAAAAAAAVVAAVMQRLMQHLLQLLLQRLPAAHVCHLSESHSSFKIIEQGIQTRAVLAAFIPSFIHLFSELQNLVFI